MLMPNGPPACSIPFRDVNARVRWPAALSASTVLAMEPQVMLFDEPTSGLDPELRDEVLRVMRQLVEEGMTMICVTHEMGFARQVANRVILMDGGQSVEMNTRDQIFSNPQHARTKLFLSQILR